MEEGGETNPVLRAIRERRSIRSFKDKPVPREVIRKIIEAGNWAPSVRNLQPWRFVVVRSEEIREVMRETAFHNWKKAMEALREENPEEYHFYEKYVERDDPVYFSAPVTVFVIGLSSINLALACENMMLAAHSMGLGSCYVGWGALIKNSLELIELLELKAD